MLADAGFPGEDQAALIYMVKSIVREDETAIVFGRHELWVVDGKNAIRMDDETGTAHLGDFRIYNALHDSVVPVHDECLVLLQGALLEGEWLMIGTAT